MLTSAQRAFLTLRPDDRPRWPYSPENRDRIDDLVLHGFLAPALGEFQFAPPDRHATITFGVSTLKIAGVMQSLYRLTEAGRRALAAANANALT